MKGEGTVYFEGEKHDFRAHYTTRVHDFPRRGTDLFIF